MVLAQKPSLLLLDEPTASLDRETSREILAFVRDYTTSSGAAVLLIEQNADAALAVSDRVVCLDAGRLTGG